MDNAVDDCDQMMRQSADEAALRQLLSAQVNLAAGADRHARMPLPSGTLQKSVVDGARNARSSRRSAHPLGLTQGGLKGVQISVDALVGHFHGDGNGARVTQSPVLPWKPVAE